MLSTRTSRRPNALIASLVTVVTLGLVLPARFASAQPTGSPDTPAAPTLGDDEHLYACKNRTGDVAVTFKPETDLKDLITWVMSFTCKNFIFDPRIVSTGKKVTVISPNKMSPGEAYRVFLVALSTMGLTVVTKGNAQRIVESATAKGETVPIYKSGLPGNDEQIVRYILKPSYAQVETIRSALDSMKSAAGSVAVAGSLLVITDYASSVRDMMSLAKAIDVPGANAGIYTIPVLHADATQLQLKLNEILGVTADAAASRGAPPAHAGAPPSAAPADAIANATPSKILVDERTNTLIVVSSEPGYMRVKSLVDRLDIVLDTEGGAAVHVYPLENALAEELAVTLNSTLQGTNAAKTSTKPDASGAPAVAPMTPGGGDNNLGAALEGQVKIIGDKPTNSLVVLSTGRDYLALKDVIKRLDHPRRQVYIEAVILEVNLSNDTEVGTSSHGGLPDGSGSLLVGGVQSASLSSINPAASLAGATGLVGGIIGSPLVNSATFLGQSIPSFGVLFQALANQANTNILSEPHFIAIDNEKSEFSVGSNVPYKAGLNFGGLPAAGSAASSPLASIGQNIQRQDLNLMLNVTPHISSDDTVRLEIDHETKDLGTVDKDLGPTWTQRKLKTQVVVHDQESVVIGGLISETEIDNATKVPLLGDIPLIGYLFKYTSKTKKRSNLLILLTPYIIKDQLDMQAIRERKERERQEYAKSFRSLNESKYEPKIDYHRKRGLVEEINRSVGAVEEDAAALAALGHRQQVKSGALDYTPAGSSIPAPAD